MNGSIEIKRHHSLTSKATCAAAPCCGRLLKCIRICCANLPSLLGCAFSHRQTATPIADITTCNARLGRTFPHSMQKPTTQKGTVLEHRDR